MKYLFASSYIKDGKEIFVEQTPEDVSKIDTKRSAFYDILKLEEDGFPPIKFCLSGNNCAYLVDLLTGEFCFGNSEEQGAPFYLYDAQNRPLNDPLKLIYYRNVSLSFTSAGIEECKTVIFNFGWQLPGTDVKRIISIR